MKKGAMKKTVAVSMAVAMMLSNSSVFVSAADAKWSETEMPDGWVKVVNEGGTTLGYSPESGVQLIEQDGYAFKDLNKNGELDVYEDWREDAATRAADLASKLTEKEILPLLGHSGLGFFGDELDDATKKVLDEGKRSIGAVSELIEDADSPESAVKFNNALQAYVEGIGMGIPVSLSSDPGYGTTSDNKPLLGYPAGTLAYAATFDPEYVGEVSQTVSKLFRAVGIRTLLGPQIDLATEPRWPRAQTTFGEDPALARDMAKSVIGAYQSTFDEDGNDLGWGEDSINAMAKHFPGDGMGESGRESHNQYGKYAVYPGDNFEAQLIPFFDGAFNLDSETGSAAAVMPSYSIAYEEDGSMGELVGAAFSEYKIGLLRNNGYDGMITTDWGVLSDNGKPWGVEDLSIAERACKAIEAGVDQFGGFYDMDVLNEMWDLLVEDMGEEAALARLQESARRILTTYNHVDLFDNPYIDSEESIALYNDEELKAQAKEAAQKTVVMLKNENNTIKPAEDTDEKQTVYIPMIWAYPTYRRAGNEWVLPVNLEEASKYYNVVTDTVGEPSGKDDDGNPVYTEDDIIRATPEELADCDMAIVFATSPTMARYTEGGYDSDTETYIPVSLQYGEYVADSDAVRKESISGNQVEVVEETTEDAAETEADGNDNPYAADSSDNPYAADSSDNPYAADSSDNPYAADSSDNPYAADSSDNPYAADSSDNPYAADGSDNPYAADSSDNPYAADDAVSEEQTTEAADNVETTKENRSYYGQTAAKQLNSTDLDAILYAAENVPEDAKVVVSIGCKGAMVMSEFEDKVDAILVNFDWAMFDYNFNNANMLDIIAGKVEPSGLLPIQMPASMEAVEAQLEDVPRDMECYVDADGNTYDFAYGLNWSGVISDERTEKYGVAPLTELTADVNLD